MQIQAKKIQIAEAQEELRKAEVDHRIKGDGKSKRYVGACFLETPRASYPT